MRRFASLVLVLLLLLSVTGCRQEKEQTPATTVSTAPAETTEPKSALTVRELYWKMRNAVGVRYPSRYTQEIVFVYKIGDGALALESEIRILEQVIFSTNPIAFNIAEERKEISGGKETVTQQVSYYRTKDANKAEVYIYYGEPWDEWVYSEPTDYSLSILAGYQRVLHPTEFPEDMTLDAETQLVGDREAYVLRYSKSVEDLIGELPNEESEDEAGKALLQELKEIRIEEALYVDAQTYTLLQSNMEFTEPGEKIAKMLYSLMTGVEYENKKYPLSVTSLTKNYRDMIYTEVEVPPVPEEAFKALKGFGAT